MKLIFFMQKTTAQIFLSTLAVLVLVLAAQGWSAPTLARLSFWAPQERMAEFEADYQAKVVPILKKHGLVEYSERGRSTVEGVFSRLFELKNPAQMEDKATALREDVEWQEILQNLGTAFGTTGADGLIQYIFWHYSTPAGSGKVVSAGRGQGHWRTYDVMDGLASGEIFSIYQDRSGNLWFGTDGGGVSRYDGMTFTTFTTKDGLANDRASSIYQDKEGNLWFGTGNPWGTDGGGVSRYNGATFNTFTTEDGLADNKVTSILQDKEGNFWFGTYGGGVSRYNGTTFNTFTTKDGLADNIVLSILQDKEDNLWFGTRGGGASRYNGQTFTSFTTKDGLAYNRVWSIWQDKDGYLWFGTEAGGISRYNGHHFATFTTKDGLASNWVRSIFQDREGNLWFGTAAGVSLYDGHQFTTFTTQNGLADNSVYSIWQDKDGYLWFGAESRISRYDPVTFTTFTIKDGLAGNSVYSMIQDREGNLWFGTRGGGVSRYDGQNFTTFTTHDGLAHNVVWSIFEDREDNLWFGTYGGVSRYSNDNARLRLSDGQTFTTFTTQDGLVYNSVRSISEDKEGHLWFGTEVGGVSRYDGQTFTTFTTKDGLANNHVYLICQDKEGHLWFGTEVGGVSHYDGQTFTNLNKEDGLASNQMRSIFQDKAGYLWFGTHAGVVSQYDGQVFQTLTRHDGLTGNSMRSILQDRKGNIWFATYNGVVRYRPPEPSPPPIFIDTVVADRRYKDLSEVTLPSTVGLVTFEFHGTSFKTRPQAMVYRYRLKGYDEHWKNTNARQVEYQELPGGNYTFEVIAVDRDLVYSESPASVKLKVVPPFYLRASFLIPIVGLGAILLATSIILTTAFIKHRRRIRAYERTAVLELQDANRVQMSLMPQTAPAIKGVEIAGKCLPANTVSGDFFDYLEGKSDNEIALVVADVAGKAMKGAMNAVMTDGILRTAALEQGEFTPSSLMMTLNNALKGRMEQYMNVTMVIGIIDANAKTLTLSNAAHHAYPLLLRDGEIQTLKTGGLPLGMRAKVEYIEEQFPLQNGDVVIFMTDGIIEAQDSEEQQYSDSGRLEKTILQFTQDLSAESMVEVILNDAIEFGGDKLARDAKSNDVLISLPNRNQNKNVRLRLTDDMTVVIAKLI